MSAAARRRSVARQVDAWGRVSLPAASAEQLLYQGHDLAGLWLTDSAAVQRHNAVCAAAGHADDALPVALPLDADPATWHARRAATWSLPAPYDQLDVASLLQARCTTAAQQARVDQEMALFEARDLLPVLRLLAYLVAHFRERQVVLGVGRGSSVASYCLFLLGVHRVDSLAYDLDIREFLRD